MSRIELNINDYSGRSTDVFGTNDVIMKQIEQKTGVSAVLRGSTLILEGEKAEDAKEVIETLFSLSGRGKELTVSDANYALSLLKDHSTGRMVDLENEVVCHTVSGKPVKPKTFGQKRYVDALRKNMIVFGIGPAGTGKTYLAIASAVEAFRSQEVSKIILTRPAIEAGEKLGFLPGDLQSKIDPYLRPLYDALFQLMGAESFSHHVEKGEIEVAPLAYMRGRTLDNAYIILDEAQNTTPSQMKMFLTRIGFQSKCVITGDRTQKDLPKDTESGLDIAMKILKGIEEISFIELTNKDVVRHPLVQKIVEAYEKFDAKQAAKKEQHYDRYDRKRNR